MPARPRSKERSKTLRFACWNEDGVRGRKLQVEHFLNQHSVEICVLSETFLNNGQNSGVGNYAFHRTETDIGGGTTIMIRRGIVET